MRVIVIFIKRSMSSPFMTSPRFMVSPRDDTFYVITSFTAYNKTPFISILFRHSFILKFEYSRYGEICILLSALRINTLMHKIY